MESTGDKHWAKSYLLDPLSEPQPAEETGPGTHFVPENESSLPSHAPTRKLSKGNPRLSALGERRSFTPESGGRSKRSSYPSPPHSSSPTQSQFPSHRKEAFGEANDSKSRTRSRGSSLGERFPGDNSHRPLDQIKQETKAANRSHHLRKKHLIPPDQIDSLSSVDGTPYHHEGPFDAALHARNSLGNSSPLLALERSNRETLKATPRERIIDSVRGHRPLDGVATYAPGETDINGRTYDYQQGENMMTDLNPEGGAYKRWPGVTYHPDDIKGKAEPSYSVEERHKEEKARRKAQGDHSPGNQGRRSDNGGDYEMTSGPGRRSDAGLTTATGVETAPQPMWDDGEETTMHRLKKRLHKNH